MAPTSSIGSPRKAAAPTARSFRRARQTCCRRRSSCRSVPVAAFTPWNFPINQLVRKVSAALDRGMLGRSPRRRKRRPPRRRNLLRAFVEAGVPGRTSSISSMAIPAEISEYLIPHPIIQKISFTGSTADRQASRRARRPAHEARDDGARRPCAGHRAAPTPTSARASKASVASKYRNAGQVCVAPTRYLVEKPVFGDFLEQFVDGAKALKVGSGLESGVQMGPLANARRIPFLQALIADAVVQGRRAEDRRRPDRQQGQFHGADRARQRAARGAHHERGAVRAGRDHQPDRVARRRDQGGQPPALRPRARTRSRATAPTSSASAWRSKRA